MEMISLHIKEWVIWEKQNCIKSYDKLNILPSCFIALSCTHITGEKNEMSSMSEFGIVFIKQKVKSTQIYFWWDSNLMDTLLSHEATADELWISVKRHMADTAMSKLNSYPV